MNSTDGPKKAGDHRPATGFLVLNKPSGVTSRRLVDQVARLVGRSKIGHAGTLDPLASGVLIICVGTATRLVENVQDLPKSYRAVIRLGARSDTDDADGRIEVVPAPRAPSTGQVQEALCSFSGTVAQTPPAFSAVKISGQRAYDLARAGRVFELAPRLVRIDRIELLHYDWPFLKLEIDCGGGTYIRSIARDLGEMLGCGGLIESLVRTRTGPFTIEQAVDPADLSAASIFHLLRPALDGVPGLPRLRLSADHVNAIAHGQRLSTRDFADLPVAAGPVALIDSEGTLIGLGELDYELGRLQPRKLLI